MEGNTSLLWTALPLELVLQESGEPLPQCVDVLQEGRVLQVLPVGRGLAMIQRLISGNPQDYLDARWQPGTRIPLV